MPRRMRQQSSTGIHHVMLRGVDRQEVFHATADYEYFRDCIQRAIDKSGAKLLAYCLMFNHVHLLIEEGNEPISVTVKRFAVSYVNRFNRRYQRVGHLFQDRFASKPVEDDAYLLIVLLYIHANPVTAGICEQPAQYRWSSRRGITSKHDPLLDLVRLEELVPISVLLTEEVDYKPRKDYALLDPDASPNLWSDGEIWELAQPKTGVSTKYDFQCLPRDRQVDAFRIWRAAGVAVRRIAQLTGYGRTYVSQWGRPSLQPAA